MEMQNFVEGESVGKKVQLTPMDWIKRQGDNVKDTKTTNWSSGKGTNSDAV